MVSITKLALAIVITQQPLCAIGVLEKGGLSQDQFEALIKMIPDNNVRNNVLGLYENKHYGDLEDSLLEYLDEYMESSFKGEERDVVERKKEQIIDGVVDFIDNAAEADHFEDIDSFDAEDKDEDDDVRQATINENKAIAKFEDIIKTDLVQSKKAEASQLLNDKDFGNLEDFILNNIDYGGKARSDVQNRLAGAMDLLWHSF